MAKHLMVLLVDDDLDLLEVLKEALITLCGVEKVVTATSLFDVQNKKDEVIQCHLSILDVNLGQNLPSGVDVANYLHQIHFSGDVVFLTGHAVTEPEVVAAAKIPGTRVFAKPIHMKQLIALTQGEK